ncbi:hypothetical protein GEM_2535 [Burkholderia cepacia GG4]|uniref:Uncharacterized protein n=2 Tax=Burkholderia cepacia TaxID=292 RepID=A0A9W3K5A7_BURCE|nr:hypothetical protein GEM_2535 [Burkholderia cepacia GG4]
MGIIVFFVYGAFVYGAGSLLYMLIRFASGERTPERTWSILTRPQLVTNALAFPLGAAVPPLFAATVRGMDEHWGACNGVAALYGLAGVVSLVLLLNRPRDADPPSRDAGPPPVPAGQVPRKARRERTIRLD